MSMFMIENMTILAIIIAVVLCLGLIFFISILSNMIISEGRRNKTISKI